MVQEVCGGVILSKRLCRLICWRRLYELAGDVSFCLKEPGVNKAFA